MLFADLKIEIKPLFIPLIFSLIKKIKKTSQYVVFQLEKHFHFPIFALIYSRYMASEIKLKNALISVFYKDGLEPIVKKLHDCGVILYSTGGTQSFIENLGIPVVPV